MPAVLTKDTEVWVPCVNLDNTTTADIKSTNKKKNDGKKNKKLSKSTIADIEVSEIAAVENGLWERGLVLTTPKHIPSSSDNGSHHTPDRAFVKTYRGTSVNTTRAFPANPSGSTESDMCALRHIHMPGILFNLQQRSLEDQPYTLMGPVMVTVNPLKRIPDPKGILGSRKALSHAHPFGLAEQALQQLSFGARQKQLQITLKPKERKSKRKGKNGKGAADTTNMVDQSIVVSGESGAGKTEASKMVLAHLVSRCGDKTSLDRRLLASNPVLEAFGNATTHRNPNSSRFGKLLRLEMLTDKINNKNTKSNRKHKSKSKNDDNNNDDDEGTPSILGATIETYLLERSRITSHQTGERSFHIYYLLLHGLSKSKRKIMGLSGGPTAFTYATPAPTNEGSASHSNSGTTANTTGRLTKRLSLRNVVATAADNARGGSGGSGGGEGENSAITVESETQLAQLRESLEQFGIHEDEQDRLFSVVAAVLHLGNISVTGSERIEGRIAIVNSKDKALGLAADQLGLGKDSLVKLLCERKVRVGLDVTVAFKTPEAARFERDALARAVYARTFEWLVARINSNLTLQSQASGEGGVSKGGGGGSGSSKGKKAKERSSSETSLSTDGQTNDNTSSICVLDIFGFEFSLGNGLEQLLINYANQALQATFDRQVFQAEAELYKREGLTLSVDQRIPPPPSNIECMVLLNGTSDSSGKFGKSDATRLGILGVIDAESAMPQPSDRKLITQLHSAFGNNNKPSNDKKKKNKTNKNCFGAVHPKDRQVAFVVEHYAGHVTYVVGSFLLKNKDHVPPESDECMLTTTNSLVDKIWRTGLDAVCPVSGKNEVAGRGHSAVKKRQTIVSEFRIQMDKLISTLEATRCSFIRCVKPNAAMQRTDNDEKWFDAQYVTSQLRCLSVPQTIAVLRSGFPTRILYASLSNLYSQWLPSKAIKVWKVMGGGREQAFVAALFWAFEVPRDDYKLGITRAFFAAGKLASLDKVLEQPRSWKKESSNSKPSKDQRAILQRFSRYFVWRRWRVCFAKVVATNQFIRMLNKAAARANCVIKIQTWWRACTRNNYWRALISGVLAAQRVWRGRSGRMRADRIADKASESAKKKASKTKKAAKKAQAKAKKAREVARQDLFRAQEKQRKELDIERRFNGTPTGSPSTSFASSSDDGGSKDIDSPRTPSSALKPLPLVRQRAGTWSAEMTVNMYGGDERQGGEKKTRRTSMSSSSKITHWCLDVECLESTVPFDSASALEDHLMKDHMLTSGIMNRRAHPRWQDNDKKLAGRERYRSEANILTDVEIDIDKVSADDLKSRAKLLRQSIKRKSLRAGDESVPALVREVFNTTIASEKAQLKAIMAHTKAEHEAAKYERALSAKKAADARSALSNARKRVSINRVKAKNEAEAEGKRKGRDDLRRLSRVRDRTSLRARSALFQVIHQNNQENEGMGSMGRATGGGANGNSETQTASTNEPEVYRPRRVSEPTLTAPQFSILALEQQQQALGGNRLGRGGSAATAPPRNIGLLSGWVSKLAIRSRRNWTTRFMSFNTRNMTISYYKAKQSAGTGRSRSNSAHRRAKLVHQTQQPQSHPQGVFEVLATTIVTEISGDTKLPGGAALAWVSGQLPGRGTTMRRSNSSPTFPTRSRSSPSSSTSKSNTLYVLKIEGGKKKPPGNDSASTSPRSHSRTVVPAGRSGGIRSRDTVDGSDALQDLDEDQQLSNKRRRGRGRSVLDRFRAGSVTSRSRRTNTSQGDTRAETRGRWMSTASNASTVSSIFSPRRIASRFRRYQSTPSLNDSTSPSTPRLDTLYVGFDDPLERARWAQALSIAIVNISTRRRRFSTTEMVRRSLSPSIPRHGGLSAMSSTNFNGTISNTDVSRFDPNDSFEATRFDPNESFLATATPRSSIDPAGYDSIRETSGDSSSNTSDTSGDESGGSGNSWAPEHDAFSLRLEQYRRFVPGVLSKPESEAGNAVKQGGGRRHVVTESGGSASVSVPGWTDDEDTDGGESSSSHKGASSSSSRTNRGGGNEKVRVDAAQHLEKKRAALRAKKRDKLVGEALVQLSQLDDMFMKGEIDEVTFMQLTDSVVENAASKPSKSRKGSKKAPHVLAGAQVMCINMSCRAINNTALGSKCKVCRSRLPGVRSEEAFESDLKKLVEEVDELGGLLGEVEKGRMSAQRTRNSEEEEGEENVGI